MEKTMFKYKISKPCLKHSTWRASVKSKNAFKTHKAGNGQNARFIIMSILINGFFAGEKMCNLNKESIST